MTATELQQLVTEKIKNLRPKLLDLSRRNPLISTRLSPRSSTHIRVVDELPDVLFYKLNNNQTMRLVPLPDIETDPLDENTKAFRDSLSNARLTDDQYRTALDAIDRDAEDYLDVTRRIERELKDRVRYELGLPKRQSGTDTNLVQHAKNHGITPSYELPDPAEGSHDRHADNDIQTLFLPKDLERKLDAIFAKCRTWMQETGINVMQVAYGFLEWSEPNQTGTSFAPLILSTATLEKKRTRHGSEYWIRGAGEDAELNGVMSEKLRLEFGIELPPFDGTSVEDYIATAAAVAPKNITWKLRRQIAVGVFPSARMAMYHDLDPEHRTLHASEIVRTMLTGSNSDAENPFGDEYNVDEPHIEAAVPHLVMDADSSQFSTLVDIAEGKNVAVEGPPGTGKSQTIVNAIASALAAGKKVLFVAEKLAALNVVKSRLDAVGLGEFLLTLQAERSTREQVIASIRERIEMDAPSAVRDYALQLTEFQRSRSELAEYIALITAPFKNTGFSAHEILGKTIASSRFDDVSTSVINSCSIPNVYLSRAGLLRLKQIASDAAAAHVATRTVANHWRGTRLKNPNRFVVEEACELAKNAADGFVRLAILRERSSDFGVSDLSVSDLESLSAFLADAAKLPGDDARDILAPLLISGMGPQFKEFVTNCVRHQGLRQELDGMLALNASSEVLAAVHRIDALCSSLGFESLDRKQIDAYFIGWEAWLTQQKQLLSDLEPMTAEISNSDIWLLSDIDIAHRAIRSAGATALLYRNTTASEPGASSLLRRCCAEGRQLREEWDHLQIAAPLALEASVHSLTEWTAALRAAGTFSVLSSRFRRLKREVAGALNMPTFEKSSALAQLERVLTLKRREDAFTKNVQVAALFGHHFSGVHTDFESFETLASFYDAVNSNFSSPQGRALRQALRTASVELLELIPSTESRPDPSAYGVSSYANLASYIADAENGLREMKRGSVELEQLSRIFKNPSEIEVHTLSYIAKLVETFLTLTHLLDGNTQVQSVLGSKFAGAETDAQRLEAICQLLPGPANHADLASSLIASGRTEVAQKHITELIDAITTSSELLHAVCRVAHMSPEHFALGTPSEIAAQLKAAAEDREGLLVHAAMTSHWEAINECGIAPLADHLIGTTDRLDDLAELVEAAAMRTLAKSLCAEQGQPLAKYSGQTLNKLRSTLANQDRTLTKLSRKILRHRIHTNAKPPRGVSTGKKSTWTQKALLDNEIAKQQRFAAVRDLTRRAGEALLELKPCWMMSPLAVAQYIPKGGFQFDLCIIDEASQMPPEAAIGALLRAKQVVVVGDTNQLPPSSFFRTVLDDEDTDEDDTVVSESILEMANATFRPARRLRWHYRSRHSGLIKFSNRLVYDDNLVVFPSASEAASNMGVEYKRIDGFYKAGTNPIEARAVVDAILDFMRSDAGRSLGVVTLNQRQRDLIREELNYALSSDKSAQAYVDAWNEKNDGLEDFFIENLENVQGKERDVIFIGTVYGPESAGAKVHQRFGPINGVAGKRRLNVLFSRAKQKIVTFSSMTSADIVAEANGNIGAFMLKRWLDYAATGQLDAGATTPRGPDSDFEVFVADQVRAMGLEPVHQVGVAGYFIDLGIRHPDWPYGYILGVECDGASYHSAKSARDRDRLRQEVLEGLGWKLHRIWSTDWFNNPRLEAERLRAVVNARFQELKAKEHSFRTTAHSIPDDDSGAPTSPRDATSANAAIVRDIMNNSLRDEGIEPGDTVRIRYLDSNAVLQFLIHHGSNDPDRGLVNIDSPLAKAVLGLEPDEEGEVLKGSYVRKFTVESVIKAPAREEA